MQLAKVWVNQSLCKGTVFNTELQEGFTMKADMQAIGSSAKKVQKLQYNM